MSIARFRNGARTRRPTAAFAAAVSLALACALPGQAVAVRANGKEPTAAREAHVPGMACPLGATAGDYLKPLGGSLQRMDRAAVLAEQSTRPVVLLGERHDSAEDHRWQLHTIAQLHALRPHLVLGFEMFPRRLQAVLDRWVAGELGETDFLQQVEWNKVWGHAAGPYLAIFHYARMNRIPMLALNVDRSVVSAVARRGGEALSEAEREGVGSPAPPSEGYRHLLRTVYDAHPPMPAAPAGFERFVAAQVFWDRAMAERIAESRRVRPEALVVGVMGVGHVRFGYGVAHQLSALGIAPTGLLHTLELPDDCRVSLTGSADALYVLQKNAEKN